MATLILRRKSQWSNGLRSFSLYLNGEKLGKLKSNETIDFEIPQGHHILTAKIDWLKSREYEFDVKSEEKIKFEIHSERGSTWLFPVLAILMLSDILAGIFTSWESGIISGFFWGLFAGAFIGFGARFFKNRDNYLITTNNSLAV
ncbi:hypothetical protein RM553_13970 [Zunongwangia sp. F363]|uniref:PEGA domain-containing protein n=1 Tax=Autumnicola tepida TaxID=3075595 RepID=A0ABU3CC72_9FLAO|nr:hypothetical protein [Zunongwangia sp. F363]MDT0643940.1 hypothetical protein [Zunongwangia sp. F363]